MVLMVIVFSLGRNCTLSARTGVAYHERMTRLEKVNLQLVMVKAAYNISSGLRDFSFRSEEHSHRDFRLHRPSGFYTLLKSGAELRICLHILLRSDHARLWRAQARGLAPLGRVHHIQS